MFLVLALAGCRTGPSPAAVAEPSDPIEAIVAAPDRDAADRALDSGRKPAELLRFLGVTPGMRVGELCAGGGYTTELLARAVAPAGQVYAENPARILQMVAAPWAARLSKPVNGAVTRLDRELDDPFPAEAVGLDLVAMVLCYHDTVWMGTDRARMNHAVYAALKPGGRFVVVDHAAAAGAGVSVAESLHRIEESTVTAEVTGAGFRLAGHDDFLRNPADPHDWNDSPKAAGDRRGTSDRFALAFARPAAAPAALAGDSCATDDECVVTNFAGCCACPQCSVGQPRARSRADLARETAACAVVECNLAPCNIGGMCPPGEDASHFAGRCVSGVCTAERVSGSDPRSPPRRRIAPRRR